MSLTSSFGSISNMDFITKVGSIFDVMNASKAIDMSNYNVIINDGSITNVNTLSLESGSVVSVTAASSSASVREITKAFSLINRLILSLN